MRQLKHLTGLLVAFLFFLLATCQAVSTTPIPTTAIVNSLNGNLPTHAAVTSLVTSPLVPQTMFAGTYDSVGLYRSDDAGATWYADNAKLPNAPVFALLAMPRELFAGTAEGLYRRAWNATEWQRADPVPQWAIYGLARDDAGAIYAATDGRGIWKSEDQGNIWTRLPGLDYEPLLSVLPLDGQTLFAGTGGRGLFVTRDGGKTWQQDAHFRGEYVTLIVGDPQNMQTIYARARNGLFRSRDTGGTWREVEGGLETEIVTVLEFLDDVIIAGSSGGKIMASRDDGATWQEKQVENPRKRAILSFLRIDKTLYAGFFDGLLKSDDDGATWQVMRQGPGTPKVYTFAVGARQRLFVAAEDGLYEGDGAVYASIEFGANDVPVTAVAIAPNMPGRIYVGTDGKGVFASDDGGQNWSAVGGELGSKGRIAQLTVDPANPEIVFARVLFERIYKSVDGGDSWRTVWTGVPVEGQLQSMAIAPSDSSVMYAGGDSQFFASEDSGETWKGRGLSGRSTLAIWVDPQNAARVMAGTTDGLYASEDGGKTWTDPMVKGTTVTAIVRDAQQQFYIGTAYDGVWRGDAGFESFSRFGLEHENVIALRLDAGGNLIVLTKRRLWVLEGQ